MQKIGKDMKGKEGKKCKKKMRCGEQAKWGNLKEHEGEWRTQALLSCERRETISSTSLSLP